MSTIIPTQISMYSNSSTQLPTKIIRNLAISSVTNEHILIRKYFISERYEKFFVHYFQLTQMMPVKLAGVSLESHLILNIIANTLELLSGLRLLLQVILLHCKHGVLQLFHLILVKHRDHLSLLAKLLLACAQLCIILNVQRVQTSLVVI